MLPVLQAEESLRRMTEVAMGSGTLSKDEARQVHQAWLADARTFAPPKPKPTQAEFAAALQRMGIAMQEVPRDG
ncbi:MAG: hypothetical protein ACREK6_18510 [Candidatus Rokuibacteriota bacterium]